ncbi:MAG: hypothetical protein Q7K26_06440 [bacterium]|nr:hypothetical protein [bacterium]
MKHKFNKIAIALSLVFSASTAFSQQIIIGNGVSNPAADPSTIAIGDSTTTATAGETGLGPAGGAIAIGNSPTGNPTTAINGGVAIGYGAKAIGFLNSTAVGPAATASGISSSAFGQKSEASGTNSVAIGVFAKSANFGSVAIGSLSQTTRDFEVNIGSRLLGGVNDGVLQTDAVNVRQMEVTAAKTLAAANEYTDASAYRLNSRIDTVSKESQRGIAAAIAMSAAIPSLAPGERAIAAGVANYGSQSGLSVVAAYNTRSDILISGGVSSSISGGPTALKASAAFKF